MVTPSTSWMGMFGKLNIEPELLTFLDVEEAAVAVNDVEVIITAGGHTVTVPMKAKHIQMLASSDEKPSEMAKASLSMIVNAEIKKLYSLVKGFEYAPKMKKFIFKKGGMKIEDVPGGEVLPSAPHVVKVETTGQVLVKNSNTDYDTLWKDPPSKPDISTVEALPGSMGDWECVNPGDMASLPMVKLRDAKKMYQPVTGTSPGSRYYVVAGMQDKGLMVAARYQGAKLSVRVEGDHFQNVKAALKETGFAVSDTYASIHLECSSDIIARKALGAILVGTGLPFSSPVPLLAYLKGK